MPASCFRFTGLVAVLAAPALARQDPLPPQIESLRAAVEARVERGEAPSIAVGVGRAGEVVWEEGFGWMDPSAEIPAGPRTPYPVASLTKSITATAVLLLAERELVDLDAPVAEYLGGEALRVYEGDGDQVTLRRLLAHTAGIPHGWVVRPMEEEDEGRPSGPEVLRYAIVAHPPGQFRYTNFGYGVAEAVIEAVSGTSYHAFLQENLFDPLGMQDGSPVATRDVVRCWTTGDDEEAAWFVPAGGAGAYASVRDLLRYGFFHLGQLELDEELLSEEKRALLHRPARYGATDRPLGFGVAELEEGLVWTISNGRLGNVSSNLTLIPSEGLVVAVLAASGTQLADELGLEIADAFVPGLRRKVDAFVRTWEAEHRLPVYPADAPLRGVWGGRLTTSHAEVELALSFDDDGLIWVTWDEGHEAELEGVRGGTARLTGRFRAELPFLAEPTGPQRVELDLHAEDGRLFGSAVATFQAGPRSYAIAGHVELHPEDG